MEIFSMEKFVEKLECEVYPITLIKFLLNKGRILSYFTKALEAENEIRVKYQLDPDSCEICKEKANEGILCRQHTSMERIFSAKSIVVDLDTNTYFHKNEIFRMVGDKLVIVYCPHPKLITGEVTDSKVRKINPITVKDKNLTSLPPYEKISELISTDLMQKNMKCWFNNEFSIVTIPNDRMSQNWCLFPNK
jgi:hypothetical protein